MQTFAIFAMIFFSVLIAFGVIGPMFKQNRNRSMAQLAMGGIGFAVFLAVYAGSVSKVPEGGVVQDARPNFLTVPRAPGEVELNRAWSKDSYLRSMASNAALSASGYPVVVVRKPWVVCASLMNVKEASDAMRAERIDWVKAIPNCVIVPVDLEAEWTKDIFVEGISEFRFEMPGGGRPITMYGSKISNYYEDWAFMIRK
jgi:hypothetical protein